VGTEIGKTTSAIILICKGEADEVIRGVDRKIKNKKLKNNIYYINITNQYTQSVCQQLC